MILLLLGALTLDIVVITVELTNHANGKPLGISSMVIAFLLGVQLVVTVGWYWATKAGHD